MHHCLKDLSTAAAGFLLLAVNSSAIAMDRFDGIYAGVLGGWNHLNSEIRTETATTEGANANGMTFGGVIGTGYEQDGVFIGLEAMASYSDGQYEVRTDNGDRHTLSTGVGLGVNARAGWVPDNDLLFYGLLGWHQTETELEVLGEGELRSQSTGISGIRLGVGSEFSSRNNNFLRLEYSMTFHDDHNFNFDETRYNVDPVSHTFLVSAGYRF